MPGRRAIAYVLRRTDHTGFRSIERQMARSIVPDTIDADTTGLYRLNCTDCSYEDTVEGDLGAALDAANAHQEARGDTAPEHFVNLELEDVS